MAGGDLRGVPAAEEQRAALELPTLNEAFRYDVVVGDDPELVAVIAELRTWLLAQDLSRRGRGRRLDIETLLAAAHVLERRRVPLTTGPGSPATTEVADALRVPDDTARNICRRLAKVARRIGARPARPR